MSPISSKKSVPPSAIWNRPLVCAHAPVKAPLSWPNSSLSSKVLGIAAQLRDTKRCLRRGLASWIARAITSFPVPVSPWIKTAESTGATLATSVSNARNFGLDPIKSKVVIALLLYECAMCSVFSSDRNQPALRSVSSSPDPLADVWIAIHQRNAGRFALSEKSDPILTGQSHIFEVEDDAAVFPFRADERFQLRNILLVDPAA